MLSRRNNSIDETGVDEPFVPRLLSHVTEAGEEPGW